jgi:hypothetical protein
LNYSQRARLYNLVVEAVVAYCFIEGRTSLVPVVSASPSRDILTVIRSFLKGSRLGTNDLDFHSCSFGSALDGLIRLCKGEGLGNVLFDMKRADSVVVLLQAEKFQCFINRSATTTNNFQFVNNKGGSIELLTSCTRTLEHLTNVKTG